MLTRRDLLKAGLIAPVAAGMRAQAAVIGVPQSTCPPTPPFLAPLPIPASPPMLTRFSGPGPNPGAHQHYDDYLPQRFHEVHVRETAQQLHPNLPETIMWGYDGQVPGPTFRARYGEPMMVRIHNDLPRNHVGFGIPEITTHLHNSHNASESDGFPADFYPSGAYHDHHYCNKLAGDDTREALSTLWYHDHRYDFTAQNVYKGLSGFFLLYDEVDTGDERTGLQLPSGEYDVPLMFADKLLDRNSQLVFDFFNLDGILGDKYTVNGAIQPYLKVARRKYRFRLLDGGPSRFYEFALSNKQPMLQIASDGNLLPFPVLRSAVRVGVAERVDVIIDFSRCAIGESVYLVNQLEQIDGRKPSGNLLKPAIPVVRFDVDREAPDYSANLTPATRLRELPTIDMSQVQQTRTWVLDREKGSWTINGKLFDVNQVRAKVKQGSAEIWTLKNVSGGWAHPMHVHFEEFQILSRNGRPAPPWEGRKDVLTVGPNEEVKIYMRFRDFLGRYPMHCHNLIHEDHAMMVRWDIVP